MEEEGGRMIREMELLFQASRTSPMLHEAAVVVEEGIAALRTERDELVLQNERLGDDIVAAEARCARLQQALRRLRTLVNLNFYGASRVEAIAIIVDALVDEFRDDEALAALDKDPSL